MWIERIWFLFTKQIEIPGQISRLLDQQQQKSLNAFHPPIKFEVLFYVIQTIGFTIQELSMCLEINIANAVFLLIEVFYNMDFYW